MLDDTQKETPDIVDEDELDVKYVEINDNDNVQEEDED